jgi:hypothetical protein
MTDEDWLACTDPEPMLEFLRGKASDRKLRLFAAACCRAMWKRLTDVSYRWVVEAAERFADGQVSESELQAACDAADTAFGDLCDDEGFEIASVDATAPAVLRACCLACWAAEPKANQAADAAVSLAKMTEQLTQARLFRDIFGNPFRPVTVDPSWLTSTVVSLAQTIYDQRAFDRLPLLADAAEEAGFDNLDLLNHLRGDGPHVLGCWAVDLVLGKM